MPTALKTLELRWRRALLAAGFRPFAGQLARAEDLLHLPPAPRILLIRMERIGDVLGSVPVFLPSLLRTDLNMLRRNPTTRQLDLGLNSNEGAASVSITDR